jgi:glutaredoxin-related protein
MKYFIGKKGFKTKKGCEKYTREIIYKLGLGEIDENHEYFTFFLDLLNNHNDFEEKNGVGVFCFIIQSNQLVRSRYEMSIKRKDGSSVVFSWVSCCEFKTKPISHYLSQAMRRAIADDVISYKRSEIIKCNNCGSESENYENYHVDHDDISFKTLMDNFLKTTKLTPPITFDKCKGNLTCFKSDDLIFKTEWVNYHTIHRQYQLLCRTCNLTKK